MMMFEFEFRSVVYVLVLWILTVLEKPVSQAAPISADLGHSAPVGHGIRVYIRRRRSEYWDFWQLNSNICPPSLCYSSDGSGQGTKRPRGTGGSVFYNGDIVLDSEAEQFIYARTSRRSKRATIRFRKRLWKDGILYYKFDSALDRKARKAARAAMKHISERTCIQFKKKTDETEDFVRIISEAGCWSNVGRVGGEQKLSLGDGCEQIGTAIHELSHALGFWHEHARPDRNKYVEILFENISPRYVPDFDQINSSVANSRGFPYDYKSIMHYKERTFTNNGGKTIKVIGVGKSLKMTIGQREALSELDIAQLRDMYRCNQLQDKNDTACTNGWKKYQMNCYLFVTRSKAQFAAAKKHCAQFNSHLLRIDNKYEDRFIKKYTSRVFPRVSKWRTGGRRVNGSLMWDIGEDSDVFVPLKYTNWKTHSFLTYTSLVLFRNRTAKDLEWRGDWVGSAKHLPKYAYPFICEKDAKRKCIVLQHKDGRDYRGTLAHTRQGITCQHWTSRYPHQHNLIPANANRDTSDGLGPHNYCRNPAAQRRNRPWCYTTKEKKEWEYCDVSACSGPLKNKNKNKVNVKDKTKDKSNDRNNREQVEVSNTPVKDIEEDTVVNPEFSYETDYPVSRQTQYKTKRDTPDRESERRHKKAKHKKMRRDGKKASSSSERRQHKHRHRRRRHRGRRGHKKG